MAPTVERNIQGPGSPKDVGRNLRQVRKQQGLSRGAAARSAGLTRRELAAYERGKVEVPESDLWCLAGSCGVDVSELLPRREPLRVSPDLSSISTGDTIRHLRGPAEPDGVLREYLSMIYELRNLPPGSAVPLRQPDLTALAEALGGTPDSIEHRLIELIGASPQEAARLRAMILPPLSLPGAPLTETPRVDPYAALSQPEASPAVEEFFSHPPAVDVFTPTSPFANPTPFAVPPVNYAPPTDVPSDLDGPGPATADPFVAHTPMPEASIAPPADPFVAHTPMPEAPVAPPADPFVAHTPMPEAPVAPPADPFGLTSPPPLNGPGPSDPFAGPVDPNAAAASSLPDPFAPMVDDPLAPPPLPPDPFAVTPLPPAPEPTVARDPNVAPVAPGVDDPNGAVPSQPIAAAPFTISPSGNGSHALVDDPFAPHWEPDRAEPAPPDSLGINVTDAIVVDDPLAPDASPDMLAAPPAPNALSPADVLIPGRPAEPVIPRVIPGVARIAWNADTDEATSAEANAGTPVVDTTPRFERASAHWQIGGIFPATAMADDGTLALRRADARWALTDLRAGEDCIIEAAFDFRAGSGFGIIFRGAVDDGERITGYSFDVDPIAGGGGYLLRLWEDSRQHWRPLAQAPVTDPAQLYGRHVVRLALRADQLTVSVDGDTVLEVPALSRSTVELGRQPCRGDRVGVQAWSTTEVTVESFRVASL